MIQTMNEIGVPLPDYWKYMITCSSHGKENIKIIELNKFNFLDTGVDFGCVLISII